MGPHNFWVRCLQHLASFPLRWTKSWYWASKLRPCLRRNNLSICNILHHFHGLNICNFLFIPQLCNTLIHVCSHHAWHNRRQIVGTWCWNCRYDNHLAATAGLWVTVIFHREIIQRCYNGRQWWAWWYSLQPPWAKCWWWSTLKIKSCTHIRPLQSTKKQKHCQNAMHVNVSCSV